MGICQDLELKILLLLFQENDHIPLLLVSKAEEHPGMNDAIGISVAVYGSI